MLTMLSLVMLATLLHAEGCVGDCATGANGRVYSSNDLRINKAGKLEATDGTAITRRPRGDAYVALQKQKLKEAEQSSSGSQVGSASSGDAVRKTSTSSGSATSRRSKRRNDGPGIALVIGGSSEDGVAKTARLPVID